MNVRELSRVQLDELKENYVCETVVSPSYEELATAMKIPDDVIFEYYADIQFSDDDFCSTAWQGRVNDVILMIHLDYNDVDPGYILYKVNENDLKQAKGLVLAAKAEWDDALTDKSIEDLIEDEFKAHGVTYECLIYDVLSLYML